MKKSTVPRLLYSAGAEEHDIRYVTGLALPDPYLLLMFRGTPHLVVSILEAARVREACPGAVVHTPPSLIPPGTTGGYSFANQIRFLLKKLRVRHVAVGAMFPVGIARAIEALGLRVSVESAPPFPQRAVKNARELAEITRAQQAAVAAMRAAVQMLRLSAISRVGTLRFRRQTLTSEALKDIIERTLFDRGYSATGTIVAVGMQGAQPHHHGEGPVYADVPIVMDIFPRHKASGYWGDITRTVVRGVPTPAMRRMYEAVLGAQKLGLRLVRPGAKSRDIQQAVQRHFEQAGFETRLSPPGQERGFIHSVGHGVGLEIHEAPGLRNQEGELVAGNVVTVEPGLYYPGMGGIRIEDTVVVTADGCKILATFPKKFVI